MPKEKTGEREEILKQAENDLLSTYQLSDRLFKARIPVGSSLVGHNLAESTLREKYNLNVVAVERDSEKVLAPTPDFRSRQGMRCFSRGGVEEFKKLDVEPYLEIQFQPDYHERDLESRDILILEAALTPRSQLIGYTLKETHFREVWCAGWLSGMVREPFEPDCQI